jgi:hypothetical protein
VPVGDTASGRLETLAQFTFSTTRPAVSTKGIVSKLADLATARERRGALVRFARSAERDAVTDDGTDHQRNGKPAAEADGDQVRPDHPSDHLSESNHTHRPEGVI